MQISCYVQFSTNIQIKINKIIPISLYFLKFSLVLCLVIIKIYRLYCRTLSCKRTNLYHLKCKSSSFINNNLYHFRRHTVGFPHELGPGEENQSGAVALNPTTGNGF